MPKKKQLFIAGLAGYTGLRLLPLISHYTVFAHLRNNSNDFDLKKKTLENHGAHVVSLPLNQEKEISAIIKSCDVVVSLIGTTRAQFDANTSYETVDYQVNKNLMDIAQITKSKKFILLSSLGAEKPTGAYLKIKRKIEDELISSGLNYIILRPSFITGPGRRLPHLLDPLFGLIRIVSSKCSDRYRALPAERLASAIAHVIKNDSYTNCILDSQDLWSLESTKIN